MYIKKIIIGAVIFLLSNPSIYLYAQVEEESLESNDDRSKIASVTKQPNKPTSQSKSTREVFNPDLSSQKSDSNGDDSYFFLWFKLFIFLGFFLIGSFFILRYLKSRNNSTSLKNNFFEVVGEFPISVNKKLQIVKIVNEYLVIAVGTENVNLLTKIDNKESIDLFELKGGDQEIGKNNFFQDLVNHYLNNRSYGRNKTNIKEKINKSSSFNPLKVTANLKERINRMQG